MKLKEAYEIVIKDLKKHTKCKEYCFGCYGCNVKRLYEEVEGFYDMIKDLDSK